MIAWPMSIVIDQSITVCEKFISEKIKTLFKKQTISMWAIVCQFDFFFLILH